MVTCRYQPLLSPWGRRSKGFNTGMLLCTNFLVLRVLLTTPSISPPKLAHSCRRWLAHGPQNRNIVPRSSYYHDGQWGREAEFWSMTVATERLESSILRVFSMILRTLGPSLLEVVISIKKVYFPLHFISRKQQFLLYSAEP